MSKKNDRNGAAYPRIRLPSHVRPSLYPYADLFETVVLPIVSSVRGERASRATKVRIRESIEQWTTSHIGFMPHPWLLRFGLLLCCYHGHHNASAHQMALLRRTHAFIRQSFAYYETEDLQSLFV